jgi:signal transduction histidine kinase
MNPESTYRARAHDIARTRLADDDLRRLAAVGLMTMGVVHDVNNMLQITGIVLQTIGRNLAEDAPREICDHIADGLEATGRATALSRRLMTFGRPGYAKRTAVEIGDALRDLSPMMRWTLGSSIGLSISADELSLRAVCDRQGLEAAIINLAVNARHAMPDGGRFTIRSTAISIASDSKGLKKGDYVKVTACDTGFGMTPEILARAFDSFFTTRSSGQGFGLGLSSIRTFVEAEGGHLLIDSEPTSGTTIDLYLPRAATSEPPREARDGRARCSVAISLP